jgi:uncharacterized membrane protein
LPGEFINNKYLIVDKQSRLHFVDLHRAIALLVMIEVHVFNSMLIPSIKQTGWFSVLNFINGLVAPSFLFVSGIAFVLSSRSKLDEQRKFGKAFWKRLQRIGLVFIAGYSLHLPVLSMRKMIYEIPYEKVLGFYNVDVLQCIATGLLLLLIIRLAIKNDRLYHFVILTMVIIIIAISPLMWSVDFGNYLPIPLANYFNQKHGSFFPLFPWLGFMFSGVVIMNIFLEFREKGLEEFFVKRMMIISLIVILLSHLLLSDLFPQVIRSIRPNPIFFVERLAYVCLIFSLCFYFLRKKEISKSLILDVSRESLLVYWLHLTLLFGVAIQGKSIVQWVNTTFGVLECLVATIIMILLMILAAKTWGFVKFNYPRAAAIITAIVILGGLAAFFVT